MSRKSLIHMTYLFIPFFHWTNIFASTAIIYKRFIIVCLNFSDFTTRKDALFQNCTTPVHRTLAYTPVQLTVSLLPGPELWIDWARHRHSDIFSNSFRHSSLRFYNSDNTPTMPFPYTNLLTHSFTHSLTQSLTHSF